MNNKLAAIFRLMPEFKGKRRLAHFLLKIPSNETTNIEIRTASGRYICPNVHEPVAFDILINGIYEKNMHELLLRLLPPNGIMVDLGANIGSISIPLCRKRKDIRCVCVEASPWVFNYLEQNVELNGLGAQIRCINKAIFDRDRIQLPFFGPKKLFGKGSLAPVYTDEPDIVDSITVDTLIADLELERVDIIKIDIEGFEYLAFKGALNLLQSPKAPDILFEFVDWAEENAGFKIGSSQQLLQSLGYTIYFAETIASGENKRVSEVMTKGGFMFFATKRQLLR